MSGWQGWQPQAANPAIHSQPGRAAVGGEESRRVAFLFILLILLATYRSGAMINTVTGDGTYYGRSKEARSSCQSDKRATDC